MDACIEPVQWGTIWDVAGLTNIESILEFYEEDFEKLHISALILRRVKTMLDLLDERIWGRWVDADYSIAGNRKPPPPPPSESWPHAAASEIVPFDGGKWLCRDHRPKSKHRRGDLKYWFFQVVRDNCKECVRFCVNKHGLNADVVSDNKHYSATEFAVHEELWNMVGFLESL